MTVGSNLGNYMNTRFSKSHEHDFVNHLCTLYILSTNVHFQQHFYHTVQLIIVFIVLPMSNFTFYSYCVEITSYHQTY